MLSSTLVRRLLLIPPPFISTAHLVVLPSLAALSVPRQSTPPLRQLPSFPPLPITTSSTTHHPPSTHLLHHRADPPSIEARDLQSSLWANILRRRTRATLAAHASCRLSSFRCHSRLLPTPTLTCACTNDGSSDTSGLHQIGIVSNGIVRIPPESRCMGLRSCMCTELRPSGISFSQPSIWGRGTTASFWLQHGICRSTPTHRRPRQALGLSRWSLA